MPVILQTHNPLALRCSSVRVRRGQAALLLVVAALVGQPAEAFEIESSTAQYRDRHYQFELIAVLDAPVDRVQAVLRDYERYPELDSRILKARVLERPTDYSAVLETVVRACFGPFCRNVKRVERVEESPMELSATADPQRSDVRFGETRTMLSESDGRTRISYRTNVEPAFWIPPFVGKRWMLRTLQDVTTGLFMNVEKQARLPQSEASSPASSEAASK